MTRKKFKFLALLLSSALLVSASGTVSAPVFASEVSSSVICNESIPDNAETYTLGTEKKLSLKDSASQDKYIWYKFTLDKSATCNFTGSYTVKN
ncbi:hypothetical protein SAMN06296386_1208 [Lachnospiraceae bacterium]|nr:hypothetical protein SAMN06296386_1208 [Lachnospiraceae bacterium]